MGWFRKLTESLRRWMASNAKAHRSAPERACCSRPPPGAGQGRSHPERSG